MKWNFYDPIASESYTFPVNPNQGGTPGRSKKLDSQSTAAPDGKTLIWEGRDSPKTIEVQGVVLTQDELEAFDAWFEKRHQIRLTDDLGRVFWVYITDFKATRNNKAHYPWHHSYTMAMSILDYP